MACRPSLLSCVKLCLLMFVFHTGGCNLSGDIHNFSLANVGPVSCSECQCAWGIDEVSVFSWDYSNEKEIRINKYDLANGSHDVVSYKSSDLGPTCWQASKKTAQYLFVLNKTHNNASGAEGPGRQLPITRIEIVQGVFNAVSPYVLPSVQLQCHGSEKSSPRIFTLMAGKNSIYIDSSVNTLRNGTWQLSGWKSCSEKCRPGTSDAIFDCIDDAGYPAICAPPKPTQSKTCNVPAASENGFPIHESVAWSFRDTMSKVLFLLPCLFIVSLCGCCILLFWAFDRQDKDGYRTVHVQIYGDGRLKVIYNMLVHHLFAIMGAGFGIAFLQSGNRRGGSLAAVYCGPPDADPKDPFGSIMWIVMGGLFHMLASVILAGWFRSGMRSITTEGRGIGGLDSAIHGMVRRHGRQAVVKFSSLQALQRFDLLRSLQAARPVMVDTATGNTQPAPTWHAEGFTLDQVGDALAKHSNIFGLVEVKILGDWCDDDPDSVELDLADTGIGADMVYYDIQYFDDQDRVALIPFSIQSRAHAFLSTGFALICAHVLLIGPLISFWLYVKSVELRIYFRKLTEKHPEYEMDDMDNLEQDLEDLFRAVPFSGIGESLSEAPTGLAHITKVERWLQDAYEMHWRISRRCDNDARDGDDQSSVKELLKRSYTTSPAEVPLPGLCMEGEEDTQPLAYRSASAPSTSAPAKQSLLPPSEPHQYGPRWSKEQLKLDHLIGRGVEVVIRWYAQFLDGQSAGVDESICGGEEAFQQILSTCHGIWNAGRAFRRDEKWAGVLEAMRRHLCIQTCQALARWDVDQVIQLRESIEALGAGGEDAKLCEMQCKLGALRLETAIDAVHLGNLQVQEHLAIAIIQAELLSGGAVLKALPQDEQDRFTELLSTARSTYQERLYHDVQRIICTAAVKELLGEGKGANPDMVIERLALADLSPDAWHGISFRMAWQDLLESKSIIQQVQLLFDQTADDVVTRDRRGDDIPLRLEVVKVKRSVNMDIYKPYFARRTTILETISELDDVGLNLQGARTVALTGCWLDLLLVNAQGVWRDGLSGELWIIRGSAALKLRDVLLHDESSSIRQRDWPRNLAVESIGGTSDEKERRIRWTRDGTVDAPKLPDLRDSSRDCVSLVIHELPDTSASSLRDAAACSNEEEILNGHVSADGPIIWKREADDGSEVEVCKWFRETALLGDWLIDNGHAAVAHRSTFLEAAELAGRSRWVSKDLAAMDQMVKEKSECKPELVMLICQQFHPIWQDAPDAFHSIRFRGHIIDSGRQLELTFFTAEKHADNLAKSDGDSAAKCALRQAAPVRLSHEPLKAKAQELWLFHGTREYAAEQIMDKDFTLKLTGSHRGTMFGPGIYLADSVTKSDEYTEEDYEGLRTMLMCRCIMGRTLEQDAMSIHGHDCMRACLRNGFHSTLGRRAYDEYVVYDENQVYPEYLVWYRRVMRV